MPTGKVSPAISARVVAVAATTTMPVWASSTPAGRWVAATTNTLEAVGADSFTREVLRNYNGGAGVPPGVGGFSKGGLLVWGGGHSQSGGGRDASCYGVDLSTRAWRSVSGNSAGPFSAAGAGTYPNGEYADGKPVPTHTYCYPAVDPVNGRLFIPRAVSSYTAPTQAAYVPNTHILNIATGAWTNGPVSTYGSLYKNGGRTVWDTRRSCFWTMLCDTAEPNRYIVKTENLNVSNGDGTFGTNTHYPFTDSGGTESDAAFVPGAAVDGSEDLIVYTQFASGSTPRLRAVPFNASNIPQARITLTMGGTAPALLDRKAAVMWSKRRNALIYYIDRQPALSGWPALSGPSLVYELRAPTSRVTGTWTWNLLTDPLVTTFPQVDSSTGGFYSKARIIEFDDGELMVAATRADTPAYAFRIP